MFQHDLIGIIGSQFHSGAIEEAKAMSQLQTELQDLSHVLHVLHVLHGSEIYKVNPAPVLTVSTVSIELQY